jgi:UDP-N-acetylglucosamine--N-acetylmuramyl-(pentapeptide) pyrophosphoryl-undecaprenol N-acetylglucosamine transferase
MLGIRIVLHTSDAVLNLSDKLIGRFASEIFSGFPVDGFPVSFRGKSVQTGNPVRTFLQRGSRDAGVRITGFSGRRPVVLVMGGSQGALSLNKEIERIFDELLNLADVIHLTGAGKELSRTHARYFARPFVTDELPNLYALADVVVTRAGAGALSELAVLRKSCIVLPLEGVAHDHQVRNAESLVALGAVDLLRQKDITDLLAHIRTLLASPEQRKTLAEKLHTALPSNAAAAIATRVVDAVR